MLTLVKHRQRLLLLQAFARTDLRKLFFSEMQSLFSIDGLSSYTIAVAALAVTLAGALLILPRGWFAQRPPNFPSGPPCAPILGNLHQVPTTKSFLR